MDLVDFNESTEEKLPLVKTHHDVLLDSLMVYLFFARLCSVLTFTLSV